MDDTAIRVEKIGKVFKLPHEKTTSVKSAVVNFYRRDRRYEKQEALKDISFEIKKGEFFGIVGRNGSGKSTLLKILAGIYQPTNGQVTVNGSLTPFIELGVGFNPELTGRENVFLNGALLGFNRKEMRAMYDDIVKFAELEKFMDQKLKNYSSGMQVRLAFSIAIRAKSDILLVDEVLAVGDESFQQKCYLEFEKLKAQKKTIIFVSHDMCAVQRFCTRAVLIDDSVLGMISNPKKIVSLYNKLNDKTVEKSLVKDNAKNQNNSRIKLSLVNTDRIDSPTYKYGDVLEVQLSWPENIGVKNAGVAICARTGENVFGTNTIVDKVKVTSNSINYRAKLDIGDGNYFLVAGIFGDDVSEVIDFTSDGPSFRVKSKTGGNWEGLTRLNHEWKA